MADTKHPQDEKRRIRKLRDEEEEEDTPFRAPADAESAQPKPLSRGFWMRCWIVTLALFIVFVAILIFIIFFPKIAQNSINSSVVTFQAVNINEPKNTAFVTHIFGHYVGAGPFGATVHFPNGLSVFWNSTVLLGNISLPDLTAHGGWGTIDVDGSFTVLDTTAFKEFNAFLLTAQNVTWRLLGSATASAFGRTASGLTMNKTVTFNGMNGFPNTKILSLTLPVVNTPDDGAELDFVMQIKNPSPVGLKLGTLNLTLTYQGLDVGPASTTDLFLASGVNNVSMKTILFSQNTPNGTATMNELLSNFVKGIPSTVLAHGLSTLPDGKNSVSWLTPAIQNFALSVGLTVPDANTLNQTARSFAQSSIYGSALAFNAISITNETSDTFTSGLDVNLTNTGPLSATIQFPDPVEIYYGGSILGTVKMPSANVSDGEGHLLGQGSTFQIFDRVRFGEFTKTLLQSNTLQWMLIGNVTALALNETFTGLDLNKTVTLNGMNNFQNVQIQNFNLAGDLSNAAAGDLSIETTVLMQNPSPVEVQLGIVEFQISYQNVSLGQISTTSNFLLVPGRNLVQMSGKTNPQGTQTDVITQFINQYTSGQTIDNIIITGLSATLDGNNQVPWLQPAIRSLMLKVSLNNTATSSTP